MKWYKADIYLEGRLPIETELSEEERQRLEDQWQSVRSFSNLTLDTIQCYEGRTEVEYRSDKTSYEWKVRHETEWTKIDLSTVAAIKWREVSEDEE